MYEIKKEMTPCRFAPRIGTKEDQATAATAASVRPSRAGWNEMLPAGLHILLLKEWLVLKIIGKTSYVKLAVWLAAGKNTSIDCLDLAAQLTDDELRIKVLDSEVKRAIAELEKVGFCRTERVVQLSLLDTLNE